MAKLSAFLVGFASFALLACAGGTFYSSLDLYGTENGFVLVIVSALFVCAGLIVAALCAVLLALGRLERLALSEKLTPSRAKHAPGVCLEAPALASEAIGASIPKAVAPPVERAGASAPPVAAPQEKREPEPGAAQGERARAAMELAMEAALSPPFQSEPPAGITTIVTTATPEVPVSKRAPLPQPRPPIATLPKAAPITLKPLVAAMASPQGAKPSSVALPAAPPPAAPPPQSPLSEAVPSPEPPEDYGTKQQSAVLSDPSLSFEEKLAKIAHIFYAPKHHLVDKAEGGNERVPLKQELAKQEDLQEPPEEKVDAPPVAGQDGSPAHAKPAAAADVTGAPAARVSGDTPSSLVEDAEKSPTGLQGEAEPAANRAQGAIIGEYHAGGTHYLLMADGSIEARSPKGVFTFESMNALRSFIAEHGHHGEAG